MAGSQHLRLLRKTPTPGETTVREPVWRACTNSLKKPQDDIHRSSCLGAINPHPSTRCQWGKSIFIVLAWGFILSVGKLSLGLCDDPGGGVEERSMLDGIYGYMQLIHLVVQQKVTQHCKSFFLRFKNAKLSIKLPVERINLCLPTLLWWVLQSRNVSEEVAGRSWLRTPWGWDTACSLRC